jgi:hypothetical protein
MTSNETTAVPNAITKYQAAHDSRDVATAETFLRKAGSEYTYTRTVISAEEKASHCWRVVNRLEGNFPGGQVDLSYEFQLNDGLIIRLVIAP